MNPFGTEFCKFPVKQSFFQKAQNFRKNFQRLQTSGRHNSAMITNRQKFITKRSLHAMYSFHFLQRAAMLALQALY